MLNIFEPRYRKMYSDILMSGSRRFVTTMVNPDGEGELAEVGVVLYLEDLKEVSQQTNDAVKYVCSHKVLDTRVAIHAILNPGDSATRETYMKCEVSELTDDDEPAEDADKTPAAGEADVMAALFEVAAMQEDGKEDVRFSRDAVQKLDAGRGVGSGSLWGVVELWKSFLDARAQAAPRRHRAVLRGAVRRAQPAVPRAARPGDRAAAEAPPPRDRLALAALRRPRRVQARRDRRGDARVQPVSYTHLTLPTILLV